MINLRKYDGRIFFKRVSLLLKLCWLNFLIILVTSSPLLSQTLYIPPNGKIYVFPHQAIGIFCSLINEGSLGSKEGSNVYFLGKQWRNTPSSFMPGTNGLNTPGGLFRFTGKKRQSLASGYHFEAKAGPSFPNLSIENKNGVQLINLNDLHIRGDLELEKGHLFLKGWNIVVDDSITGYSPQSYVVTGSEINGGQLYRNKKSDSRLIFPIGTSHSSYTPLSFEEKQSSERIIGARVFDHVFENAISGKMTDSTFVKKTWQLKSVQGDQRIQIQLQHPQEEEGVVFALAPDSGYVSRYLLPENKWDRDSLAHQNHHQGLLTTGAPLEQSRTTGRIWENGLPAESSDSVSWLSVSMDHFADGGCPVVDFSLWDAKRYNSHYVHLFWRTRSQKNLGFYLVQRKRDHEEDFQTIAQLKPDAYDAIHQGITYFTHPDENPYEGTTTYRLLITNLSGCTAYTDNLTIGPQIEVDIWPNPSPGEARIRITGTTHDLILRVANTSGQILHSYIVRPDEILLLKNLADATYFLTFYDPGNYFQKIRTLKLIVQRVRE